MSVAGDSVINTEPLTDEQLRALYAWIDAIPLSRPKRNIQRDFSDGVMLAGGGSGLLPCPCRVAQLRTCQ